MSNEKAIIAKLLDIAKKQQQAIRKLAQDQGLSTPEVADSNIEYLKRSVDSAATNAGVTVPVGADAKYNAPSMTGNTQIEGSYSVTVRGISQIDEKTKENFLKTYKNQIKAQRPALDGKVSIFFA